MLHNRRSGSISLAVVSVCALLGIAHGYSGIEHAWLGIKSWEQTAFWETMDPAFHTELTKSCTSTVELHDQNMVKKLYLIGCMLPDLFTHEGTSTSRWLIQNLYGQSLPDKCPLDIYGSTYSQVAAADSFVWNDDIPNDNLPALRAMVDYAKQQSWSPWEKALIYGAYAHVVMDLHAGCFQQPSLWGKDFVLEPEDARLPADVDILADAETHDNFFQPTYMSDVDGNAWMRTMLILYSEFQYEGHPGPIVTKYGACEYFRCYDIDGRNHRAWQDTLFTPEQRFVDAVDATEYNVDNLTPQRLHAYLHGYAIMWFLIAGYPRGHSEQAGGVYSHPDWNFVQISSYFLNIGTENAHPWVMGDLESVVVGLMKKLLLWLVSVVGQVYQGVMRIWYPDLQLFDSWTYYLQEGTNLDNWYIALGPFGLQDDVEPLYNKMRSYIAKWSQTSKAPGIDKPNMRSAYRNEPDVALDLMPEMRKNVDQGPSYLDHTPRLLAKKAGLVGGMWGEGDVVYRQPGIVDLSFQKDECLCYSTLDVPSSGDPNYAQLCYDVMPFAPQVRLQVIGKTDPQDPGQEYVYRTINSSEYTRAQGTVPFDLTQMAAQGVTRVSFIVSNYPPYQVMLNSDYEETYASDQRISGNLLYHDWLKSGIATRDPGEDPIGDPRHFWPYVLQLNPVPGYYLSPPTALTCTLSTSGQLAVELDWIDNSSYEYGYKIEKTVNHSPPTYIGLLPENTEHYEDVNVAFGDTYRYRVWCERDQWKSDTTPYAEIAIIVSGEHPPTAYNSQEKIVVRGDDVHLTYYANSQGLMYVHSSDGGKTWDAPEDASGGILPASDASPVVALDAAGTPHILFHHAWEKEQGLGYRLRYWLTWPNGQGPWNYATAFMFQGDLNLNHQPDVEPPVVSFCIWGDSGFAALDYPGCDSVVPETAGTYFVTFCVSPQKTCGALQCIAPHSGHNRPTVLVDAGGRRVVVSTCGVPGSGDDSVIRISYKEAAGSSFDYDEHEMKYVYSIAAALENDSNLLVAWAEANESAQLSFGRFVRQTAGYTAEPAKELVTDDVDPYNTNPTFVANSLGLPMLVSEYGPCGQGGIRYALRLQPGSWLMDTVFTSGYYLGYPQGYCAGNRLGVLASCTEDYGQGPYSLVSGTVTLPWYQFPPTSNAYATAPNSGRKLVVSPDCEGVHVVYDAGGSVLYSASQDGGETWGDPLQLDAGNHPSVALYASDMPTVVYNRDNSVFCKMRRSDSTWREAVVYAGGISEVVGPPAVAQSPEPTMGSPYCAFPVFDIGSAVSRVWLVKLDTLLGFQPQCVAEAPVGSVDSFVSIACTPGGPVQVAWVRCGLVMCASVLDGGMPIVELVSQAPASHPFVEAFGEWVHLVWRDLQSGCIVMTAKHVGGMWEQSVAFAAGDFPACSKCGTVVFEQPDALLADDIWAHVSGFPYNLSESPNVSSEYPHLDAGLGIYDDTLTVVDTIYSTWTEGVGASLYSVRFRKLGVQMQGQGCAMRPMPPSNTAVCGDQTASPYCLSRSGRDSSADGAVDCGSDSLSYLIRYVDPRYNYLAEFTVAPDQRLPSEQSFRVQGAEIARLRFGPGRPNTVRVIVPRRSYENGTTLPVTLRRLTGERVTLAGLKLYAFSPRRARPDGVTAEATPVVMEPRLYNAAPCPSRGRTVLRYQVPRPMHVTLKIYDATGRTVRTVLDSERPAGVYTLTWDGRDQRGRVSPNGIYFCTMKAGDYNSGKKLIISR